MPTTHSKTTKKRKGFCEWFRDTINKGIVEGLVWLDDEKTIVRVPWKRVDKPGFIPDDAKLFKLYAEHTEKYRAGDLEDPSTWKTRFRCALRKMNEIQEIDCGRHLEGALPYRTFKFVEKKSNKDNVKKISKNKSPPSITPFVNSAPCNLYQPDVPKLGRQQCRKIPRERYYAWQDKEFEKWGPNSMSSTADESFSEESGLYPYRSSCRYAARIPDLDGIEMGSLLGSTDQTVGEVAEYLLNADHLNSVAFNTNLPQWPDYQYTRAEYTSFGLLTREEYYYGQCQ